MPTDKSSRIQQDKKQGSKARNHSAGSLPSNNVPKAGREKGSKAKESGRVRRTESSDGRPTKSSTVRRVGEHKYKPDDILQYQTKNKEHGFDSNKVHVWIRRRIQQDDYDLSPIVPDLEWLARYIVARKIGQTLSEHDRADFVQHLVAESIRALPRYPWRNIRNTLQPAFGWFSIVMYHLGLVWIKRWRRTRNHSEEIPEEYDKPVNDKVPMHMAELQERIFKESLKEWMEYPRYDRRLRRAMRYTARRGTVKRLNPNHDVGRFYQCIMMAILNKDFIPQEYDITQKFKVFALVVGKKRARQLQFLDNILSGNYKYNPG